MTTRKSPIYMIAVSTAMMILIFDAKTAFSGVSEGIMLCLTTVIPSVFPFFVISILLTGLSSTCPQKFLRPVGKILSLPENCESLLLIGFLGGYPVGAQSIRQVYSAGNLSRSDAQRMLAFCSNAGPSFIFGIGSVILPDSKLCWWIWLVHILSALIVGWLTPSKVSASNAKIHIPTISLTEAVNKSVRVMGTVCSWIILFRVILAFFQKWFLWILPQTLAVFFSGLLELSNGCAQLLQVPSVASRFCFFSIFLSCGGLCVALQTHAVLSGSGLSTLPYLFGKAAQGAISGLLCILLIPIILPGTANTILSTVLALPSVLICLLYYFCYSRAKKDIAFPQMLVYNNSRYSGGSTYEAVSKEN